VQNTDTGTLGLTVSGPAGWTPVHAFSYSQAPLAPSLEVVGVGPGCDPIGRSPTNDPISRPKVRCGAVQYSAVQSGATARCGAKMIPVRISIGIGRIDKVMRGRDSI
jgi:hypothetical protein